MLNTLPNNAKVFIFQADRKLTNSDFELIKSEMNSFLPQWATHGEELTAEYTIENDYFLIVGNDESKVATSGCSKDSLTHVVQSIGEKLNIDFFNRLNTVYESNSGDLKIANMLNFKKMMQKDEIKQNTLVFNNLITFKSDLLENWKVEVKKSWHKTLVPIL